MLMITTSKPNGMRCLLFAFVLLSSHSLFGESEYCGVGTIWDPLTETCIVSEGVELLDSNQDGLVGVEDLLNLLSHFGDTDMEFDGIWDTVDDSRRPVTNEGSLMCLCMNHVEPFKASPLNSKRTRWGG